MSENSTDIAAVQRIFDDIATWDHPADELSTRGITGARDNCSACPMANYIISVVPASVHEIRVEGYITYVTFKDLGMRSFDNPDKMQTFISDFDNLVYPELDDNPPTDEFFGCGCDECRDEFEGF